MERSYKEDFPLLMGRLENGAPIAYLDNAATTQKPNCVVDAVTEYYKTCNANPHRGAYALSAEATEVYESARETIADFIGAEEAREIVFTRNASEALNLAAYAYGLTHVGAGDEIFISIAEHHSNLLPWQRVARLKGAVLRYLYTDQEGQIPARELEKLTERTKIVAVTHTSNVLGVTNPVAQIAQAAHKVGAVLVLDGTQAVPHTQVDVKALGADFMAFSGHKMYGPGGIGVLYGKARLLEEMEPLLVGGGIVEQVTEQTVEFLEIPTKFEAGTPNVEGAAGLKAAIEYLRKVGFAAIAKREAELTARMLAHMAEIPEVEIYGTRNGADRTGIVAFNVREVHPHDVASILDADGVTIRAGHHCAQPLMGHLGIHACCRASISFYNTPEEIDRFAHSLSRVRGWLGL